MKRCQNRSNRQAETTCEADKLAARNPIDASAPTVAFRLTNDPAPLGILDERTGDLYDSMWCNLIERARSTDDDEWGNTEATPGTHRH